MWHNPNNYLLKRCVLGLQSCVPSGQLAAVLLDELFGHQGDTLDNVLIGRKL